MAAAVYLGLFVFNTVTRTGDFSPDSMNYVNVAQNILAGKGLTQPTVGYIQDHFSLDDKNGTPFVRQPPLYPLMIAATSKLGLSPARSALLLSALGSAAIFLLVFGLGRFLYDERVGLIAAALLLFYWPMQWIAHWAWTEPISIALLLASIWLLAVKSGKRWFVFIAGLIAGAAVATRWALIAVCGVGILFLIFERNSWRLKILDSAVYAIGFIVPLGAVFLRNFLVAGVLAGTQAPITGFRENLSAVLQTVFGVIWSEPPSTLQIVLLLLSIMAICIGLVVRGDFGAELRETFIASGHSALTFWTATYLLFLVVERSFSYVEIDARIISPGGITLVILWSAAAVRASRLSIFHARSFALILLLLAAWQQAQAAIRTPPLDFARAIRDSERLTWIKNHTTGEDLIIGQDVIDVPFYFNRTDTLSFSNVTESEPASYEKIMAYSRRYCRDYENVYLILKTLPIDEHGCRVLFGDFVCDLTSGRIDEYPGISLRKILADGLVFQIDCR